MNDPPTALVGFELNTHASSTFSAACQASSSVDFLDPENRRSRRNASATLRTLHSLLHNAIPQRDLSSPAFELSQLEGRFQRRRGLVGLERHFGS